MKLSSSTLQSTFDWSASDFKSCDARSSNTNNNKFKFKSRLLTQEPYHSSQHFNIFLREFVREFRPAKGKHFFGAEQEEPSLLGEAKGEGKRERQLTGWAFRMPHPFSQTEEAEFVRPAGTYGKERAKRAGSTPTHVRKKQGKALLTRPRPRPCSSTDDDSALAAPGSGSELR